MENLAALAVRRPIAVIVFALVITVLGIASWKNLPLDLFPDLQSPTVLVSVEAGNRPAEQMERIYGERLEQLLFTVPGLRSVDQIARSGKLITRVTFNWETDVDLALVDVNRAVASMAADPDIEKVTVRRFDTRQLPILVLGLTAKTEIIGLAELRSIARRQIAPSLEQLPGVAEARISGGRVREVQILIDPTRLKAYELTLSDVRNRISAANVDFDAGTIQDGDKVLLVRGKSRFIDIRDIERVVIRFIDSGTNTRVVKVEDIGRVVLADAEHSHLVRVNGREGIGLYIYKEAEANTVNVSKIIRDATEELQKDMPALSVIPISDEAALVVDAINDVKFAALLGIALAIGVLILFLRSPGSIAIVALSIPVSLLATSFAMDLAGHTLNLMTLGGLALGAGMLLDNTIVVIESIFRRRSEGDSPFQAAVRGTGAVGGAIAASTLTTCIVFLPVLFIEGIASRLISGIAFTVVCSLLASLFVAIFLVPALSIGFLPKHAVKDVDPGSKRIENIVYKILGRPWRVILIAALLFGVTAISLTKLGTELLPPADPRQFTLSLVTPAGQNLASTETVVSHVESVISAAAGDKLAVIFSDVGRVDDDDRLLQEQHSAENTAEMRVRLKAGGRSASAVVEAAAPAVKSLYGAEVEWHMGASALSSALGTTGPPIIVEISGSSLDDLRLAAEAVRVRFEKTPELWNVQTSFEGAPQEMHLRLKRTLADAMGVDLDSVRYVLEASLEGLKISELTLGDEIRNIVLKLPQINAQQILDLEFRSPNGELLTVGEVTEVRVEAGAREILRKNQRRVAQITALVRPEYSTPKAREAASKALHKAGIPPTLIATLAGVETDRINTVNELRWAMILALLLVFMVLAGSFESLLQPLAILAAVPLALIGVSVALVPQGNPIGVMAMLGLVVLVGIAVNDAILLAQSARGLIQRGRPKREALARAVSLRLRPIIMTTATTVLALLPLALGSGEAAELRQPLAWTVVGGVIASTLGCLFVIPCIYYVLEREDSSTEDNEALTQSYESN